MKRVEGFIDLTGLLGANIETLIDRGFLEDVTNQLTVKRYIIKIGDKHYFFKECSYREAITE